MNYVGASKPQVLNDDALTATPNIMEIKYIKYHTFSDLICTLFTVLESYKIRCRLDSWSRAGFCKNDSHYTRIRNIQQQQINTTLLIYRNCWQTTRIVHVRN
jgi:hypothetical protein